uniref:Uncharacterized protein n=1 Tax=Acrobeloides nanus TaxID=290746 RepID=A0A914D746_9BILA
MVDKKQINGVGKIILDYGYEEDVCVILAHRHFGLARNETMLEKLEGDAWVAKPIDIELLEQLGAFPNLLICMGDSKWYPVGYGIGDNNALNAWADTEFLNKIENYLIKNELQDKLMLGARSAKEEKEKGVKFMEYNYEETRTSETRPCADFEFANGLPTTYAFTRNINGEPEKLCLRVCVPAIAVHVHTHVGNEYD